MKKDVIIGFCYHKSGEFELIIEDPKSSKSVQLTGKSSIKDLEFVSEIFPICVYTYWHDIT